MQGSTASSKELSKRLDALEMVVVKAFFQKPIALMEYLPLISRIRSASNGSWSDDPVFEVPAQLKQAKKRVIAIPIQAISRRVAEQACQRAIGSADDKVALTFQ